LETWVQILWQEFSTRFYYFGFQVPPPLPQLDTGLKPDAAFTQSTSVFEWANFLFILFINRAKKGRSTTLSTQYAEQWALIWKNSPDFPDA
jgi:hypothetical protein